MKSFIAIVASLALTAAFAATAVANTNSGKFVSYKDDKVTINHKKAGKSSYVVNKKTQCGVSYGNPPQSGDSIKCKAFKNGGKYEGRPTTVRWHKEDGKKIADLVSINVLLQ